MGTIQVTLGRDREVGIVIGDQTFGTGIHLQAEAGVRFSSDDNNLSLVGGAGAGIDTGLGGINGGINVEIGGAEGTSLLNVEVEGDASSYTGLDLYVVGVTSNVSNDYEDITITIGPINITIEAAPGEAIIQGGSTTLPGTQHNPNISIYIPGSDLEEHRHREFVNQDVFNGGYISFNVDTMEVIQNYRNNLADGMDPYTARELLFYELDEVEKGGGKAWVDPANLPLHVQANLAGLESCFLAGTMITMADGSLKPIEQIIKGDLVMSYDDDGKLVTGEVNKTFVNEVEHIIDVFGLKMTPGHVTYCADGKFAGQHVTMLDILRSDGAIMRGDGTKVRAATDCVVGSEGDQFVHVVTGRMEKNGKLEMWDQGAVRAGTRFILENGNEITLLDILKRAEATLDDKGRVVAKGATEGTPMHVHFIHTIPKPEDYVMARSAVTVADIYKREAWDEMLPKLPAPKPSPTDAKGRVIFPAGSGLPKAKPMN